MTLVSGNFANTLNTQWVNRAALAVRTVCLQMRIYAVTMGRKNLEALAAEAEPPIEAVGHVYEPNLAGKEFFAEEKETFQYFTELTSLAHAHGFESVAHPTGRPVLGIGLPRWDYGRLSLAVDQIFIQTQTYCKGTRQGDFRDALGQLEKQFRKINGEGYIPQVTVGRNSRNAVSPPEAAACVKAAAHLNLATVTNWWETDFPEDNVAFLELVRPA